MSEIDVKHVQDYLSAAIAESECRSSLRERLDVSLSAMSGIDAEKDLPGAIDAVYRARNLVRLKISGIKLSDERLLQVASDSLKDVPKLPVDDDLINGLAKNIFESARKVPGERLMIAGSKRNIQIIEEIARLCIQDGIDFGMDVSDDEFEAILINESDGAGLQALADEQIAYYENYPAQAAARSNSDPSIKFNPDQLKKWSTMRGPLLDQFKNGNKHYSLTIIPTPADADLDGMDYDEYMKLFFESCDQPWSEIEKAQRLLKERFDNGKNVHITNADGTDLTLSIEGMTFANSVTLKNIPGSELFSSPVRDSVNGTIVSKGKFKFGNYPLIDDITLEFKDGKVVNFDARVGRDVLEKIITADDGKGEGVRFAGEFAMGTNPRLTRHFVNGLLVEKIGGSFHIALGDCYKYTSYAGEPVNLNNGNVSASGIHWDITTMLRGKDGIIELDGNVVQRNGVWIDEEGNPDLTLAVLNYGWDALPEEEIPKWHIKKPLPSCK